MKTKILECAGWHLLHTDGFKYDGLPLAYAPVGDSGQVLLNHILHEIASIFMAEARAILQAMNLAAKNKLKTFVVCLR